MGCPELSASIMGMLKLLEYGYVHSHGRHCIDGGRSFIPTLCNIIMRSEMPRLTAYSIISSAYRGVAAACHQRYVYPSLCHGAYRQHQVLALLYGPDAKNEVFRQAVFCPYRGYGIFVGGAFL